MVRYSIFLDPATHQVFAYAEIEDQARWNAIAQTPVWRRWWPYMKEIMTANPDDSPISRELREIFHM
jgi:L-rhamnose mutarotase